MRVKLLAPVVGSIEAHRNVPAGTEIDVSDAVGAVLVRKGLAKGVTAKAEKVETAKLPDRSEKRG